MTLAVFPIIRKASTAEATSLPSTTTLTMTTGSESADLSLLVSNASGTFSSSSSDELAKFSIATNNYTGYTLTISGSDDTGLLTNTDTTITANNTFSSIDSTINETTFDTATYNNKWGYKPSKYNSADNVSFRPAPTTTASTLDVTNVANTKKTGADSSSIDCTTYNCNDYTIGLGIRADYTKPAGTYTNTFILTATANPVGYSITYADNTGDSTVADIPAIQSGVTSSTLVTLNPDKTPTRTGYTFKSWCLGTVSSNGTVCTGTSTNAGGNLDFVNQTIQASGNAITLYATWTADQYTITLNGNGGTLGSTSTKATYNATTLAAITTPTRANGAATRTLSSFALGTDASGATVTYPTTGCTSASNCKSTATITYTFNGWYKESGATNKIANNAATPALEASTDYTNASKQWTSTSAQTLYAGWSSSTGSYSSVTLPTIAKTGYTCGWATSSTATTYTYTSGQSITPTGNLTLTGVCTANKYSLTITFAGTGVASVEVRTAAGTGGTLMGTVSSSGGKVSNLVYGTAYYLYPTYSTGYTLSAWKKTDSATNAALSSTSAANPTYKIGAGNGAVTITGKASCSSSVSGTMQAFNPCSNISATSGTLTDSRDNQKYTVAKINNQWWMTKNLNIAGGTTLTSATSNVSSNYKLPASSTSGFSNNATAYVYNSGRTNCSSPGCYSYYSYKAATAGTNPSSGNATSDICPKGWRLPTQTEFNALLSSYNTAAKLTASPFLGVYGGRYYNSSFDYGGSGGFYWSSTAYSSANAYLLRFGDVADVINFAKLYGFSVRCVKS